MEANSKAMREALEKIDGLTDLLDIPENTAPGLHPSHSSVAVKIRRIVRDALSAPPRNCDVGTADEQAKRFEEECRRHDHCTPCPVHAMWGEFKEGRPKSCQLIWAQMGSGKEASQDGSYAAVRGALECLLSAIYDYHENAAQYVGIDIMQALAGPINRAQDVLCS